MALADHIRDLQNWVKSADIESAALVASNEAIALRQLTIQEKGEGVVGEFSDYTDSYARSRVKDGYQDEYKDYTRTGELFQSIAPEVVQLNEFYAVVEITAKGKKNQDKLKGAFKKDGNILTNTDDELQLVAQVFAERLNAGLPY